MVGVVLGAALGAVVALLAAPRPGTQGSENLRRVGEELRHRLRDLASRARDLGEHFLEAKEEELRLAIEAGRKAAADRRRELSGEISKES
jgi:gas vesicle protein